MASRPISAPSGYTAYASMNADNHEINARIEASGGMNL
jgi:hypothetical protein